MGQYFKKSWLSDRKGIQLLAQLFLKMSSRNSSSRHAPSGIIVYDVPGRTSQPWTPNVWPVRLILNYKRLRHQTVRLEFQDIERELRKIGAEPSSYRSDGSPVYSLPVIVDPNVHPPRIISTPNKIADYLEATYPARPIFPEGTRAMQAMFVHFVQEVLSKPLLPIMVPLSYQQLPDHTQSHFRGSMQPAGALVGPQREQQWLVIEEQFNFLAKIMDKNRADGDGIVCMGFDVTYADFTICSILIWIERMAARDGWGRVRTWNHGRWARLWERCREYMDEY